MDGLNRLEAQKAPESFAFEKCPDENDFASHVSQQRINLAMHKRRMKRLSELEAAIKRLHNSEYGKCEECGENIGIARLKANPSARLCVLCQSEAEDGVGWCA